MFAIIRDLAIELEPARRETLEVTPDSILDRDLGIDSLARLELSLRIERGFGVRLAEQALMEAVTPADLLSALVERYGSSGGFLTDSGTSALQLALSAAQGRGLGPVALPAPNP